MKKVESLIVNPQKNKRGDEILTNEAYTQEGETK